MRSRHHLMSGVLLAGLVIACQPAVPDTAVPETPSPSTARVAAPTPAATLPEPSTPTPSLAPGDVEPGTDGVPTMMTDEFYAGPLPEGFEMDRDHDPLPDGALVKFQVIDRGTDPTYNHRWVLYPDGRLFLAWNSDEVDFTAAPFDTELPDEPTAIVDAALVQQVKDELKAAEFLNQHPYQARLKVEDGTTYILTARFDETVYEVIYDACKPPLVAFLENIGYDYQDSSSDYQDGSSDPLTYYQTLLRQLRGDATDETDPLDPS